MDDDPREGSSLVFFYLCLWLAVLTHFAFVEWPPDTGFLFAAVGTMVGHVLWLARLSPHPSQVED